MLTDFFIKNERIVSLKINEIEFIITGDNLYYKDLLIIYRVSRVLKWISKKSIDVFICTGININTDKVKSIKKIILISILPEIYYDGLEKNRAVEIKKFKISYIERAIVASKIKEISDKEIRRNIDECF